MDAPTTAGQLTPPPRQYFAERHGRGPKSEPLPFDILRRLVVGVLDDLRDRGYFQQAFGYECVDAGTVFGTLGANPDAYFFRAVMRDGIWPYWEPDYGDRGYVPAHVEIGAVWESWDPDTLFDVVEVLHDLASKPLAGENHTFNDCGWHYSTFDGPAGHEYFRREINSVLKLNDPPYELNEHGQVVQRGPEEFRKLLHAPLPADTEHDLVTAKVDDAVARFRARGASIADRHHAVRDLADALEALRADVKEHMLSADERALFNLANNFSIRHNRRDQRGDYDRLTWLTWAFYVYLATVHAVLRIRAAQQDDQSGQREAA